MLKYITTLRSAEHYNIVSILQEITLSQIWEDLLEEHSLKLRGEDI